MQIKSAFSENERIPEKFTCDGNNINPEIQISDVPSGTKSLALIVDDPDSPSGVFAHWIVFNMPSNVNKIPQDSIPQNSLQGKNDFGENRYGGPCPHKGEHRYRFKVFALDNVLNLKEGCSVEDIEEGIKGHILDHAILTGKYSRKS